jgi:hypothetical protein
LGLVEIDAIKSSDDESEIGNMNPNVRIIAYNAESKVIETVRPNGILIAQITLVEVEYLVLHPLFN